MLNRCLKGEFFNQGEQSTRDDEDELVAYMKRREDSRLNRDATDEDDLKAVIFGYLDNIYKATEDEYDMCGLIVRFADECHPEQWNLDYTHVNDNKRTSIIGFAHPAEGIGDFGEPALYSPTAWYLELWFLVTSEDACLA